MRLDTYIGHHSDKLFSISGNNVLEIDSLKNESINSVKNEDLYNFKISFDELNFENNEQAIEQLTKFINDFNNIDIDSSYNRKRYKRMLPNKEKELEYEERAKANGFDIIKKEYVTEFWNKKRREVIKYTYWKKRNREGTLDNSFVAIHTKSYDEVEGKDTYKVLPHLHIIINKKNNLGKNFSALNKALAELCLKHDLVSSCNEIDRSELTGKESYEFKILKDRLTSFSWALAKNQDTKYTLKQIYKYKGKNAITLKNLQERVDRYLHLGGSLSFVEKIKYNLEKKIGISLNIKLNKDDKIAIKNIENRKYIDIINHITYNAISGKKISEKYRQFSYNMLNNKTINIKEITLAKGIKELFKSSFKVKELEQIKSKYIKKISTLNKQYNKDVLRNMLNNILDQNELRSFIKENVLDVKLLTGKSEFELLFNNNLEFIERNIKLDGNELITAYETKEIYNLIIDKIENLNLNLSDKWKNNIAKKITNNKLEELNLVVEENIEKNRLKGLKNYKQYLEKMIDKMEIKINKVSSERFNIFDLNKQLKIEKNNKVIKEKTFIKNEHTIILDKVINELKTFSSSDRSAREIYLLNNKLKEKSLVNKLQNILDQKELRVFEKEYKINISDLINKTQFELLYENNYRVADDNIILTYKDLVNYYNDKSLYNIIEYKVKELDLNISQKWKKSIVKNLMNNKLNLLNKYKIIDLNKEYHKKKGLLKYTKELEEVIKIEKSRKEPNYDKINRLESQLERFEKINYVNYLNVRFLLEKAQREFIKDNQQIDNKINKDKSFESIIKRIEKDPLILSYKKEYRNNKTIAKIAIKSNEKSFEYISNNLKQDKEFVKELIEINPFIAKYIDKKLLKDIVFNNNDMLNLIDTKIKDELTFKSKTYLKEIESIIPLRKIVCLGNFKGEKIYIEERIVNIESDFKNEKVVSIVKRQVRVAEKENVFELKAIETFTYPTIKDAVLNYIEKGYEVKEEIAIYKAKEEHLKDFTIDNKEVKINNQDKTITIKKKFDDKFNKKLRENIIENQLDLNQKKDNSLER